MILDIYRKKKYKKNLLYYLVGIINVNDFYFLIKFM